MKRQWKTEIPKSRNYLGFAIFAGIIGICLYPTAFHPMLYPESYRKIQQEVRKGINQEEIQPGNMRVWRDPYDRDRAKPKE